MAGLCEGGNEPAGSLKSICKWVGVTVRKLERGRGAHIYDKCRCRSENSGKQAAAILVFVGRVADIAYFI
ncbi:hypothetical protein ANN_04433 [Periplaneta americana]|uniref:Uncharacterized protein n=1 Tax=Periplaneta americana TaxID=6978 RepID=A0ABQ8T8K0_PERAM|nr:hypothetical protein ANN_04433 [Periplaneta americana]